MLELWPFTNFHDLNLDWIIKTIKEWDKRLKEFFDGGGIHDYIEGILEEHPEWVTTVMDGSLELRKFTAALAMRTVNYYVTPEEFGAAGDGNTDDTDAVQDALDDGRPVLMLADYKITAPLEVSEGLYEGKGMGRLLLNDTAGAASVYSTGVDNITVKGLSFITQTQGHARYSVSLLSGDNIKVENCYFEGIYGYALRLNDTTNAIARDLRFNTATGVSGNPGGCIYAMDAQNLTVDNVRAYDIQDHVVYITGSDASPSEGHNITNVHVELGGNNSLTNGAAIVVYNNVRNTNICNLSCKNTKAAVQISHSGNALTVPANINVTNVSGDNFSENGITIAGAAGYLIEKINMTNIDIGQVSQDGISFTYSTDATMTNVNIGNATRNCIRILNSEKIIGSTITTGNTNDDNIFCDNADYITISNVKIANGQIGLYHRSGTGSQYIGVICDGTYGSRAYSIAAGNSIQPGPYKNEYSQYMDQVYTGSNTSFTVAPGEFDGFFTVRCVPSTNALHYVLVSDSTTGTQVCAANSTGGLAIVASFPVKTGHTYDFTTSADTAKQVYLSTSAFQRVS